MSDRREEVRRNNGRVGFFLLVVLVLLGVLVAAHAR
jgi:hypothetical protein